MDYSFPKSVLKMLIKVGVFALPLVLATLPQEWMNVTIGGALYLGLDFLQKKYTTF